MLEPHIGNNDLQNDFGGVMVYTDTNRYPGNIDQDSACSVPLGALSEKQPALLPSKGKVLVTNGDASISGLIGHLIRRDDDHL